MAGAQWRGQAACGKPHFTITGRVGRDLPGGWPGTMTFTSFFLMMLSAWAFSTGLPTALLLYLVALANTEEMLS